MVHGTLRYWLAFIANRNKAFSIRHEGTHHENVVQSSRMSYILICVRVALATSDVQSILDIPATDEIHILNQAEQWHIHTQNSLQTCARTATFNKAKLRRSKFPYLFTLSWSRIWPVSHLYNLSTICIITVRESGTELQGSFLLT